MRTISYIRAFIRTRKLTTLSLLRSGKLSSFRIEKKIYNTGYSIEPTWCSFDANSELLRVFIHGIGFVSIEESPHYLHILSIVNDIGGESSYRDYLRTYYPNDDVNESVSRFNLLFEKISRSADPGAILVELPSTKSRFISVVDGTHRLAIFTFLGFQKIRCKGRL
jgi:hypothetical protein